MRLTLPWLVAIGLAVCFVGGQLERHRVAVDASTRNALGVAADVLAVALVVGAVMLVSYLRTGHPLPGHARRPAAPPPEKPRPGPVEHSAAVVKLADGVTAGPSVAPVEDYAATVLPGPGELGSAHLGGDHEPG